MYSTQVEPEKIIEFCIQDGLPCYRVRWCDSWVPQESLSHTWQHLIDGFWKNQTEQSNEAGKYLSQNVNNRFLPTFANMLVNPYGTSHHPLVSTHHPSSTGYLPPNPHHHQGGSDPHSANLGNFHHISTPSHHLTSGNSHHNTTAVSHQIQNSLHISDSIPASNIVRPHLNPANMTLPTTSLPDFHLDQPPTYNDMPKPKVPHKQPINPRQATAKKILTNAKTRVVRRVKQKSDEIEIESTDGVTCAICHRDFSHTAKPKKRLREHVRRIHLKNGKFKCSQCSKTFVCQQGLRDHEPVHSKERNHRCRYCNETFLRLSHLYVHLRTHEEERNFRCEACFKTFNVQSELKEHCTVMHNTITADLKCGVCKQNLYSATSVYSHSLRHAGTRDHKCELCGLAFKRKQILNQHKKRHEQDVHDRKTLECSICKKVFATKSSLRDHAFLVHQTSLEETDHKCEVCGKCFRNWANYRRHVLLHPKISDESATNTAKEQEDEIRQQYHEDNDEQSGRQFTCNVCKTEVNSMKLFLQHLQAHQIPQVSQDVAVETSGSPDEETTSPENRSCTVCNKTFAKQKQLTNHMAIHSTMELKCDICSMVFKRRDTLRIHKKRHAVRNENAENFRSRVGEIYNNRKELREKIGKADKDGRVSCPYCEKMFNKRKLLLAHIVLHGNVFYSCDICGKSYKQRSCLNKHKKSHVSVGENPSTNKTSTRTNTRSCDKSKYQCNVCNRSYAYKKRLIEHRKIHTNEPVSDSEDSLERIPTKKEAEVSYNVAYASKHVCEICQRGFQRAESLSRHMKISHHKREAAADIYDRQSVTNDDADDTAHVSSEGDFENSVEDVSFRSEKESPLQVGDKCNKDFNDTEKTQKHDMESESNTIDKQVVKGNPPGFVEVSDRNKSCDRKSNSEESSENLTKNPQTKDVEVDERNTSAASTENFKNVTADRKTSDIGNSSETIVFVVSSGSSSEIPTEIQVEKVVNHTADAK